MIKTILAIWPLILILHNKKLEIVMLFLVISLIHMIVSSVRLCDRLPVRSSCKPTEVIKLGDEAYTKGYYERLETTIPP